MKIEPSKRLTGELVVPGDKSISHRYAILGALARGRTRISNYSTCQDCQSTLDCLSHLGPRISRDNNQVEILSEGWQAFRPPKEPLDAGNSGTALRLLSGPLASMPFVTRIGGDESLNGRPMRRIVEPLTRMGATILARDGDFPPLEIHGAPLSGIVYKPPVASAQVKSCVLLAGLAASGRTTVIEEAQTRDHTERALPEFGVPIHKRGLQLRVEGPASLNAAEVAVPGDLSSAVFFIAAALLVPGSEIRISNVGVNPTRAGFLALLEKAGAPVEKCQILERNGEPHCNLTIRYDESFLVGFPREISGEWIPNVIDELPIVAILGTQLPQGLVVRDAEELRKKESDRIHSIVSNLKAVGITVEEFPDGFQIFPDQEIRGGGVHSFGDHRIAMAFSIAGMVSRDGVEVDDPGCADISYPGFFDTLGKVSQCR
jgi:3-phosphoshikimate 1-carboxyvinyltransferase